MIVPKGVYNGKIRPTVMVSETPKEGWRLNLGYALRGAGCASANTIDVGACVENGIRIMRKNGIRGVNSNKNGFLYFKGLGPADGSPVENSQ